MRPASAATLPIFRTSRLTLRQRDMGDLHACLAMDRDPLVTRFICGPWEDPAAHRAFVEERIRHTYPRGMGYWSILAPSFTWRLPTQRTFALGSRPQHRWRGCSGCRHRPCPVLLPLMWLRVCIRAARQRQQTDSGTRRGAIRGSKCSLGDCCRMRQRKSRHVPDTYAKRAGWLRLRPDMSGGVCQCVEETRQVKGI
jgi:hypothetical protein